MFLLFYPTPKGDPRVHTPILEVGLHTKTQKTHKVKKRPILLKTAAHNSKAVCVKKQILAIRRLMFGVACMTLDIDMHYKIINICNDEAKLLL